MAVLLSRCQLPIMTTIKNQLLKVLRGFTHRDYARTVEVAKWSYQMMTGEDQRDYLLKYHTRESTAQKEQRLKVTSSKTQFASGKVSKFFNEVHRSDTLVDILYFEGDEDGKKLDALREGLTNLSEGGTLKQHLDEQYFYRNFYDPNTFQVFEWDVDEATGRILPYTLYVDAADVMDFNITHGVLHYLIIRQPKYYPIPGQNTAPVYANPEEAARLKTEKDVVPGFETQYKYTLYGKGETCEVIIIPEKGEFDKEAFIAEGYQEATVAIKIGRASL